MTRTEYRGRHNPRVWRYNGEPCEISAVVDDALKTIVGMRVYLPDKPSFLVECDDSGGFPGLTYEAN